MATNSQPCTRRLINAAVQAALKNTARHALKARSNAARSDVQAPVPERLILALRRATFSPYKRR